MSPSPPLPPAEADYQAIESAVMDIDHGDWFLEEYARRQRRLDTDNLLAALTRIERVARAADHLRVNQVALDHAIANVRTGIATVKAAARDRASEEYLSAAVRRLEDQVTEVNTLLGPAITKPDAQPRHGDVTAPSISPGNAERVADFSDRPQESQQPAPQPRPNRLAALEELVGKTCAWLNEVNDTPRELT